MKHGDSVLHDGGFHTWQDARGVGHSAYLLDIEMLAAQVNRRRPSFDKLRTEPERVSLLAWLVWDAVILAYGVAALVLLRVLP